MPYSSRYGSYVVHLLGMEQYRPASIDLVSHVLAVRRPYVLLARTVECQKRTASHQVCVR